MKKLLMIVFVAASGFSSIGPSAKGETIYSFETGDTPNATDGFNGTQSTIGVTDGSNSLQVITSQTTGYTLGAATFTNYVPSDLSSANSVTFSLTVDASSFNYLQLFPVVEIGNASTDHFISSSPDSQNNLGGVNFQGSSESMNLAVFADPDASENGYTGSYTVAQIIAQDAPYDGVLAQTLFQIDYQDSGTADGSSVPFYFDNFVVPEPSMAGLLVAGSGLAMLRRRKARPVA